MLGTRAEKAAGAIFRAVESSQRGLISQLDDPKAMWDALAAHHEQKRPATRFASYEALLGVQKHDDETLPALAMRVEKLLSAAQNAKSTDFSLKAARRGSCLHGFDPSTPSEGLLVLSLSSSYEGDYHARIAEGLPLS